MLLGEHDRALPRGERPVILGIRNVVFTQGKETLAVTDQALATS